MTFCLKEFLEKSFFVEKLPRLKEVNLRNRIARHLLRSTTADDNTRFLLSHSRWAKIEGMTENNV